MRHSRGRLRFNPKKKISAVQEGGATKKIFEIEERGRKKRILINDWKISTKNTKNTRVFRGRCEDATDRVRYTRKCIVRLRHYDILLFGGIFWSRPPSGPRRRRAARPGRGGRLLHLSRRERKSSRPTGGAIWRPRRRLGPAFSPLARRPMGVDFNFWARRGRQKCGLARAFDRASRPYHGGARGERRKTWTYRRYREYWKPANQRNEK